MLGAQADFHEALTKISSLKAKASEPLDKVVYSNVTGAPYRSIAEIMECLPRQIWNPVRWSAVLAHVGRSPHPISAVILPSPSDQLAGMLKKQNAILYAKHMQI